MCLVIPQKGFLPRKESGNNNFFFFFFLLLSPIRKVVQNPEDINLTAAGMVYTVALNCLCIIAYNLREKGL